MELILDRNPFIIPDKEYKAETCFKLPNLAELAKLTANAILVLTSSVFHTDHNGIKFEYSITINVNTIAQNLFGEATPTNCTRVRRGIADLLRNKVIAKSPIKDKYWLNVNVIWV